MRYASTIAAVVLSLAVFVFAPAALAADSLVLHQASRPARTDTPSNLFAGTIGSTTWMSLDISYLRRVSAPWPARPILLGAGFDMPVFMWAKTGDPDTIRLGVRGTAEVLRADWFALVVDIQTRFGVQDSVLNTSVGWDFQLTVAPSLAFENWSLSPFVALRQGIATYVKHGTIVHDAFSGRYPDGVSGTSGPKDGWIAGGNTRVPFGLAFGVDLPREVSLYGSAGLIWTHSPLGVGMFDSMMLGHWPFFFNGPLSRRKLGPLR